MSQQAPEKTAAKTPFAYAGEVTIAVNVTDIDRSIDWYRHAFGFELIYKLDDFGWCELSTPIKGVSVGLGQTDDQARGGMSPHFAVEDIEAAKAHLESVGATFEGDINVIEGMVKLASFKDPDGNSFGLAETISRDFREK
jgi:predicted enzyme related to lactoylglutathione lyase